MSLFNRNAPVTDSNIRILHAVPTANPIDIYANGNLIASNVSFGKLNTLLYQQVTTNSNSMLQVLMIHHCFHRISPPFTVQITQYQ